MKLIEYLRLRKLYQERKDKGKSGRRHGLTPAASVRRKGTRPK